MTDAENRKRHLPEELVEAAIEAELETSPPGETPDVARRHVAVRAGRIALGSLLLIAGVAMLALPGPGWLTIAAGLALLAEDVPFAERLLSRAKRHIPGLQPESPGWMRVALVIASLGAVVIGVVVALAR